MAAELNFFFAAEMDAAFDEGEMRKMRKPNERIPASTSVIGLVRRNALGNAMATRTKTDFEVRLNLSNSAKAEIDPNSDICGAENSCVS